MWFILHKLNKNEKGQPIEGGQPNFVITATCPSRFKEAMEKLLSPQEIDDIDSAKAAYQLIITNKITKKVVGFKEETEPESKT